MSDADEGFQVVAEELSAAGLADPESLSGCTFPTYRLMSQDGYLIAELWQNPRGGHWCATRFVRGYSRGTVTGTLAELAELAAGWAPTGNPEPPPAPQTSTPDPPSWWRASTPEPPSWWRASAPEPVPMSAPEPPPGPGPEPGPFAIGDRVIRCPDGAHGTVEVINNSGEEWRAGVALDNGEHSDGPADDLIFERTGRRLGHAELDTWSAGPPPERSVCREQPSTLNPDHSLTFCQRPPHVTGPHLAVDLRKDIVSWSGSGPVSHYWPGQSWLPGPSRSHPIDLPMTAEPPLSPQPASRLLRRLRRAWWNR